MEFLADKIKILEDEIENKNQRLEKLKNIKNDSNRDLIFDLRQEILSEYFMKRKKRMGKLSPREKIYNDELKSRVSLKLNVFDIFFDITENQKTNYFL